MKVVLAIDSFKGCLTSADANRAAAEGVRAVCPDAQIVQLPVSDGGEGWLEAYYAAVGGTLKRLTVCDPLMRPVEASYLLRGEVAVIEMAQASGLTLLSAEERNPMVATTYGTGQLVADAVRSGVRHIIVGLGGSATSDDGRGMLHALIDTFAPGGEWSDVGCLHDVRFTIATDVSNPLYGPEGAAHVFAAQKFAIKREESELDSISEREQTRPKAKGGTPEMIQQLDSRSRKFAEYSDRLFGYDRSSHPGAGSAGGLGYAFLQYLDADCRSGVELLLEAADYSQTVTDADLVITGEGSADRQTLMGKLPVGILRASGRVAVCLIAGRISDQQQLLSAGFARAECINPTGLPLSEAIQPQNARKNIQLTVTRIVSGLI